MNKITVKPVRILLLKNNSFSLPFILLIFLLLINTAFPQVIYRSLDDNIYNFLERLSIQKVIKLDDEVRPYSRVYIAELLKEINKKEDLLNKTEKKLLYFYEEEYAYEMGKLNSRKRWNLFEYGDSLFSLKVNPIVGYGVSATGSNSGHTRWWGASVYSTYSDWFGANLDATDKGEYGGNVDTKKTFSPETGAYYKYAPDGIEFSDVKGSMSFNWKWGSISLIKDYFEWGHGRFGQVILSTKAPDFPRINLQLKPVSWLRFYYFHGWLNSLVIDSSSIYYSHFESSNPTLHEKYINKYIAANLLTVSPNNWLDVSLGNSIVYSDPTPRPEMFIPFMIFKFLDHNTGRGAVDDGNGQMFFDASVKYPKDYHFYTTLFLDVTQIRNILKGDFHNTWYGLTLGAEKINLLTDNLDVILEYTLMSPWTYEHKYATADYKHLGFYLGDWLGQNADQLRIQANYQPLRGLICSAFFQRIRKGGLADISIAYRTDITEPLFYGPLRKEYDFGIDISYEFIHTLFGKAFYQYSNISDQDPTRTPGFMLGNKNTFGIQVSYGL